ncbi:MAG: C-terminal binding protein [Dehalococcoidales bacterium]|nr:C-terminal binding protein [Dehalococcoidales bacterium]
MYKVTTTDMLDPVIPEENILRENGAQLFYGYYKDEANLIDITRDADGIITFLAPMTAKVINSLQHCQVIVRRGIGYDNVDVEAATSKGIAVVNVPDYCTDEVADHTMALLLCAARRIIQGWDQVKSRQWDYRKLLPIHALKDSVLGLLGFGKIPRAISERARCFGLTVQTSDPFVSRDFVAVHGVKLVSSEELFRTSDFISVHVPLAKSNIGLVSRQAFDMMKPSAVLINTARGPVIDESALIDALKNGSIAFAALDVTTKEPIEANHPLLEMENVILTPHFAFYSERAVRILGEKSGGDIIKVFNGCIPESLVNPEVLKIRTDLKRSKGNITSRR